jgi:predicted amidohydrolase
MKICVIQAKSIIGDIQQNIANHKKLIASAISNKVDIIIFPELSITGYEPQLADALATDKDTNRFDDFQEISNSNHVTIGIGAPTRNKANPHISMVIFQPGQPRQLYSKKYLHADEYPFFTSGENFIGLSNDNTHIALAICYELSVPEHSKNAHERGASVYLTSVAKTAAGVEKAADTLSAIAANYSMTVLMANCVGECEGKLAGGKTSVWNNKGILAGQLNDTDEGILIIDTQTQEVISSQLY